jgi:hypothetical protein
MGWPGRLLSALALLGVSAVGCSDGGALGTAPIVATVSSWDQGAEARVPLGGVQLCETNTTNCTVTYTSGLGVIQVPVGQEISYTLEKEGYASYLYADIVPQDGSQPTFVMLTDELLAKQHARVMSLYPLEDKGEIAIELHPPFAGATFKLVDAAGKAYYVDEEPSWNADLTATTALGRGGFVEVSAGVFQIELGGTAQDCVPRLAWPSDAENSIEIPVQAGYRTFATVLCSAGP